MNQANEGPIRRQSALEQTLIDSGDDAFRLF
jgi:hypothetical protein